MPMARINEAAGGVDDIAKAVAEHKREHDVLAGKPDHLRQRQDDGHDQKRLRAAACDEEFQCQHKQEQHKQGRGGGQVFHRLIENGLAITKNFCYNGNVGNLYYA